MTTLDHSRFVKNAAPLAGFVLAAMLFLALLGPFGTMLTMDWPQRFAHWTVSGCAIGLITAAGMMAVRWLRRGAPTPLWLVGCVAAAAALPGAFIIEACLRVWSPDALAHVSIAQLLAQCALLNLTLTALAVGLSRPRAPDVAARPANDDGAQHFRDCLPRPFRDARIDAIIAEDHYLRVHTDRGDTLVHMRIGEAENLLKSANGLRVHRSHWVARAALARVKRHRGQIKLVLANGLEAPVARARQDALKQAGWLVDDN